MDPSFFYSRPEPHAWADRLLKSFGSALRRRRWGEAYRRVEEVLAGGRRRQQDFERVFNAVRDRARELQPALPELEDRARLEVWPRALLFCIYEGLSRWIDLQRVADGLRRLPGSLGWMRFYLGAYRLKVEARYEEARGELREAFSAEPGMWKARAYLAEIALCRGLEDQAFAEFDAALEAAAGPGRAEALAWRGALRLWQGDYRGALKDLDPAAAEGVPFSRGWRGAAKLRLGREDEALEDLNAGLSEAEGDDEARVWRAELYRGQGRPRECIQELGAVLERDGTNFWARANRGLALGAMGRRAEGELEFAALSSRVRRFLRQGAAAEPEGGRLALLERGLERGRGLRRSDRYLEPIWMG